MSKDEAIILLSYHSQSSKNVTHPKWKGGFLGMLRPFRGELIEENYLELMAVIQTLSDELRNQDRINARIISDFWAICHSIKIWALEPDGMLQRNHLLRQDQISTLSDWHEKISETIMFLLEDQNDYDALGEL